MSARVLALCAVLSGCGSTEGSAPTFHNVPMRADAPSPEIQDVAFDARSVPYLMTSAGLLKFDGEAFVPFGPTPAIPNSTPLSIEADGTIIAGGHRLAPGATAWETIDYGVLPGATLVQTVRASDGSWYAVGNIIDPNDPTKFQVFHRVDTGPWTPVGPPHLFGAGAEHLNPDAKGAVWFETGTGELYVARGDTAEYVFRSQNLGIVGPDATLYYLTGPPANSILFVHDDARFNAILAVTEDGSERMITRGSCVDGVLPCPSASFVLGIHLVDRTFYQVSLDPSRNAVVMMLEPGALSWRPVADLTFAAHFGGGVPLLHVAPDKTMWATMLDQVGGIDPDSSFSYLYGYVFRIDD